MERTPTRSSRPKISVMIVDDQIAIRHGFSMIINRSRTCSVTHTCDNGHEAIEVLARLRQESHPLPEVVMMDIRMPIMDGITATTIIKEAYPHIAVVALTTYDQDDYAFRMLTAGASGFLLKDVRGHELISAIEAVHAGDAVLTPRITGKILARHVSNLEVSSEIVARRAQFATLSERETDIVVLVAQGLTNAEIAKKLFLEPDSVKKAVSRILAKLSMRDRVQLAIEWVKCSNPV